MAAVIADCGVIVAEFFDAGCSRQVMWDQRPEAAALLVAATSSERSFDAIVVGDASGADRERNPHRSGQAWTVQTLAAILSNPRCTGRQVWQRHPASHSARASGSGNSPAEEQGQEWAVSKKAAHPELVSERDFVAVQAVRAGRLTKDGRVREYLCAGLLLCRMCGRRMDAHWVNDRPGYRCRRGGGRRRDVSRPTHHGRARRRRGAADRPHASRDRRPVKAVRPQKNPCNEQGFLW
ncbi:recombinase family protein [Nocardiopsis sp. NRRL B-16309]|uniref:recombinase family protein n=1 Tax=Nocardiopsis sp. NRRL B-16309 TaxID=1519494 RepID=UPI0018D1F364|nr:recombinase family protein [Nocardiopsis sp. NRRL B-16309]